MGVVATLAISGCRPRTIRAAVSARHNILVPTSRPSTPPWIAGCGRIASPLFQVRGKKTTVVVKIADLPQGRLPPLPPDDLDDVPAKSYPRVLQQHLDNVKKYRDCVVLTRVGDFYEMYFDQVDEYAPLVNLKKAKRSTSLGDVSMAGFQHAQLERYLKMFVLDLGKPVAISEQYALPRQEGDTKPRWDRKVNRVVTAGTLIDESFLDAYENNYLLSIHAEDDVMLFAATSPATDGLSKVKRASKLGISWVDVSNGDFFTQATDLVSLPSLVARINPKEIILDPMMEPIGLEHLMRLFGEGNYSMQYHQATAESLTTAMDAWVPMLERAVSDQDQATFTHLEVAAGGRLLDYIKGKLPDTPIYLQPPIRRSDDQSMMIDKQSLRGLEIRATLRDGLFQGSLLHSVRRTVTKSGARLLSQRLVSPSMSLDVINRRLNLVEELLNHEALHQDIVALLRQTSDTLRLLQRFSIGRGDADDLLGLARTIEVMRDVSSILLRHSQATQLGEVEEAVQRPHQDFLSGVANTLNLEGLHKIEKQIFNAIDEEGLSKKHSAEDEARAEAKKLSEDVELADELDAPKVTRKMLSRNPLAAGVNDDMDDIWIMRKNASPNLKKAHADLTTLLEAKQELAQRLRTTLGADSLALKWSGGLGHHCHVKGKDKKISLSDIVGARETGSSKSTKTFYYSEWTQLGHRIEEAKLRIRSEEENVFRKLRAEVIKNLMTMRRNAAVLDELDVACSSATVAKERNLVRPILNNGRSHRIIGGRHATVDEGLRQHGRPFTPNDCLVGDREQIYLITGPNMAGKSTYLRQNALITILAQTGCFVPAEYAEIGLVDKIFSRVGSADNLYQDQSTFMVEMLETAEILKQATPRSFVIMDEVGRGTTPTDGVAVAYACLHHLYHTNRSRTLFATHFHLLADMTQQWERLAYYCTDITEDADGHWSYLHRLQRGVNRQSHALKVAELAGVPSSAIEVARSVIAQLEQKRNEDESAFRDASHQAKLQNAAS